MSKHRIFTTEFGKVYPTGPKIRYLDKLVNELAKGKPMDKILRS